nr:ribonuclease H family protein [Vibrio splendidus]MCC4881537.1 ribonuclease H family protein [Vibrio splendidus]
MKDKVYVVWVGRETGIFRSWNKVLEATKGFSGAKYKAFTSAMAPGALKDGWEVHYGQAASGTTERVLTDAEKKTQDVITKPSALNPIAIPDYECLTVDASFSQKTKQLVFRGVLSKSKKVVFTSPIFIGGSANVGEYLAIVEGIKYLREHKDTHGLPMEIYSDSVNAIGWYFNRAHRSNVIANGNGDPAVILKMIMDDADEYLKNEDLRELVQIKKWHTQEWNSEIPADFGRK